MIKDMVLAPIEVVAFFASVGATGVVETVIDVASDIVDLASAMAETGVALAELADFVGDVETAMEEPEVAKVFREALNVDFDYLFNPPSLDTPEEQEYFGVQVVRMAAAIADLADPSGVSSVVKAYTHP